MTKKDEKQVIPVGMEMTPRGVIRLALGGYGNPESKELTEKVENALLKHMERHDVNMTVFSACTDHASIRFLGKNP